MAKIDTINGVIPATMLPIVNSGETEKTASQNAAIEKMRRDEKIADIIRKDTAIVHAATLEKLSRAVYAETLRHDVAEIATIGNVVPHHKEADVYVITLRVTHKYIGKTKNFRVSPMPLIRFAYHTENNTVHMFGVPEMEERKAIVEYGKPLAIEYFKRMSALNSGATMEEMLAMRPYNMLTLPEFASFVTSKKNVTQAEMNVIADEYAAKVMPKMD